MDKQLEEIRLKASQWTQDGFNKATQEEVQALLDAADPKALVDAFYQNLEFGTGGLRGIMGAGSNRMNIYTVGMATQGFANYLNEEFKNQEISVVVGHDVRNNSRLFAETVANIFSANNIKVYLFEGCRPTPEISFAIRHFKSKGGVNITASHNPKEYNGYKAYWEDGAQLMPPHDTNIVKRVGKVAIGDIKFDPKPENITIIAEQIDSLYQEQVVALSLAPDVIKKHADTSIVYTPIHGVGSPSIPDTLRKFGFQNIHLVPEQEVQSGDFPTVDSPNPEETSAMKLALQKAQQVDADLVLASDPDADRIGIGCRNLQGDLILLNGNQTAALITYYLAKQFKISGKLTGKEFMVKTIVTSDLLKEIIVQNGIEFIDCFTGFKYIAEEIKEREGKKKYLGGGEESFGYLVGDFVRDKDAVSACCFAAEITAWAKEQGKSLYELLIEIYKEYGLYKELNFNLVKKGKEGQEEIANMMKQYRFNPPSELDGVPMLDLLDYNTLTKRDLQNNSSSKLDFKYTSNVLQFNTEDKTKLSIRPSGTEPKIKFYVSVQAKLEDIADFEQLDQQLEAKLQRIKNELGL